MDSVHIRKMYLLFLLAYARVVDMTNSESRNANLQTMSSCWAAAADLGFSPTVDVRGPARGSYMHRSRLLSLIELDGETTWEVILFERRVTHLDYLMGRPDYREFARVRLTRVSVDQFRVLLTVLVAQVEG